MPSGRDSFRRNRVAPVVLLYSTIPAARTPLAAVLGKAISASPGKGRVFMPLRVSNN